MDKFSFLKSVRFWNLVIVATVIVLNRQGIIVDGTLVDTITQIIAIALGGSTVIKTVDRNVGDAKIDAAIAGNDSLASSPDME
jgi:hypothetical protein